MWMEVDKVYDLESHRFLTDEELRALRESQKDEKEEQAC